MKTILIIISCLFLIVAQGCGGSSGNTGGADGSGTENPEGIDGTGESDGADESGSSACTSSDDFSNPNTLDGCYIFSNTSNHTNVFDEVEGAEITVSDGQLRFDMTTAQQNLANGFDKVPSLAKAVSGDFDIQITVNHIPECPSDGAAYFIVISTSTGGRMYFNQISCGTDGNHYRCGNNDNSIETCADIGTPVTLRLKRIGQEFTIYYRALGESDFTQIDSDVAFSIQQDAFVAIAIDNQNGEDLGYYLFDDLIFNSGSAVGQD